MEGGAPEDDINYSPMEGGAPEDETVSNPPTGSSAAENGPTAEEMKDLERRRQSLRSAEEIYAAQPPSGRRQSPEAKAEEEEELSLIHI